MNILIGNGFILLKKGVFSVIKRYLSCILIIFMIILSVCALANKEEGSTKLSSVNVNLYQNKIILSTKQLIIVQTNFKLGDRSSKVKEIQQKLNKFGYKLYEDGYFGRLTYNAVIDFQMRNKITVDGIVGNMTIKKLNMVPTSQTLYKTPVIQKAANNVTGSNNALEKTINSKNNSSLTGYFIWIDLSSHRVNIFNGYNKKWHLVKSMVCSSGKRSTPTIKGHFKVGIKGSYFISSGGARCKYYTQISGNYLFHSVLYDRKGNYIIDNTLGASVSHGCVRLALSNAKYIYDNIPTRTSIWSN